MGKAKGICSEHTSIYTRKNRIKGQGKSIIFTSYSSITSPNINHPLCFDHEWAMAIPRKQGSNITSKGAYFNKE
jgi:hypothetical protein